MYTDKEFEAEARKREEEVDSIGNYLEKVKRIKQETCRLKNSLQT